MGTVQVHEEKLWGRGVSSAAVTTPLPLGVNLGLRNRAHDLVSPPVSPEQCELARRREESFAWGRGLKL